MPLNAEVAVIPGLVDAAGQPVVEPYRNAVADFLSTPGVTGTALESEFRNALVEARQETGEGWGWWDALRDFFAPEYHVVADEVERAVELDAYWLMLPAVPGATAKLSVSTEASDEISSTFSIAGIGGGPTIVVSIKENVTYETKDSRRITVSAPGLFQRIEVTRQSEPTDRYSRLVRIDGRHLEWSYPSAEPPSATQLGTPDRTAVHHPAPGDVLNQAFTIKRGTTWEQSLTLNLAKLGGIEAKIASKNTYQREVTVDYTLPGGHSYTSAYYPKLPGYVLATAV